MRLLTLMLGSIAGIGLIGLIVIFQPEIRRVLLVIGNRTVRGRFNFLDKYFKLTGIQNNEFVLKSVGKLLNAITSLSQSRTGALFVFSKTSLPSIINSGQIVDAELNSDLIQSIFFKNTPLHDGAMLIQDDRIVAASCILPVSSNQEIPKELGLRHRAALGVSEQHEVLAVVVSEQNGSVSYAFEEKLFLDVTVDELKIRLQKFYLE